MGALSQALQGQRVYLDSNVFIYALEGVMPWATPGEYQRLNPCRVSGASVCFGT